MQAAPGKLWQLAQHRAASSAEGVVAATTKGETGGGAVTRQCKAGQTRSLYKKGKHGWHTPKAPSTAVDSSTLYCHTGYHILFSLRQRRLAAHNLIEFSSGRRSPEFALTLRPPWHAS